MKNNEINKLIAWLMAMFPSWKPDKIVTAMWANELPDVEASHVISIIKQKRIGESNLFPPNCLEILSYLNNNINIAAKENWSFVLSNARLGLRSYDGQNKLIKKALSAIGGMNRIRMATNDELVWLEKEFIACYKEYQKMEAENVNLVESNTNRQIGTRKTLQRND